MFSPSRFHRVPFIMGAVYRVKQFMWVLQAIVVPLPSAVQAEIGEILTEREQLLFARASRPLQWHSYRVMRMLRDEGHRESYLLTAALLHDIGKAKVRLYPWDLVLAVLAMAFVPRQTAGWGCGEPRGWRRPFVVKAQHAAWSADMGQSVGCDPRALDLMRRHQDAPMVAPESEQDYLLLRLQMVDDQC